MEKKRECYQSLEFSSKSGICKNCRFYKECEKFAKEVIEYHLN